MIMLSHSGSIIIEKGIIGKLFDLRICFIKSVVFSVKCPTILKCFYFSNYISSPLLSFVFM